jgi:hypothetical protein
MKISLGRGLQLLGVVLFLAVSFMPWYDQSRAGIVSMETAWDGEYSLASAAGAVFAGIFGVLALLKGKPLFNILALLGGLAALAFAVLYYQDNSDGFEVYGIFYPSKIIHNTVYMAIGAAALISVGGLLGLKDKSE